MAESGWSQRWRLVAAVSALVVVAGCGLTGKHDEVSAAPAVAESPDPVVSEEPTPEETTPSAAPTTKATKPPKPKKKVTVEPTQPAFWNELPACAHYDKTKPVSKTKVKAALKAASARIYWRTEAPTLKLNYPLVKAVAWQESGWKSNIHNCDGGTGIMQVMPGTVTQMNERFVLEYDATKYQDNAFVGANYLAWLTKWAAYNYFKNNYSLSTAKCKSHTSWCLLNVVISAYNAGPGAIETAAATKTLTNPEYVAAVRSLMSRCQCDQY